MGKPERRRHAAAVGHCADAGIQPGSLPRRTADGSVRASQCHLRATLPQEFPSGAHLLPQRGFTRRTGGHQLYIRHNRLFERSHAALSQPVVQHRLLPRNVARSPGDHIVSMLPLGHVFGMVYDFLYGFSAGAHLYFLTRMPSPKIIAQSFAEIRPRVISCVPLIVEKIIKKDILPRVDNRIGKLLLRMPIINDHIKADARKKAMEIFGGNFDEIIIGGAPFNADVERFLKSIGFPYTIAYGMTECGPIICSSRWETLKLASCGKATSRMEVKIDSSDPQHVAGEIVCRGANLMLGYYKNPEATAQIIDANGWLHTGDLGTMDKDGYVTVRGRSKNMLLTASGQNIYPEEIESKLNNMPYVSESLVVLQKDKLVALIYPDFDDAFAHGLQQKDIEGIMENNRIELNQQLPAYCQITKVKIHFEEFEKTAKKSIKRFMYQEAKG